MCDTGEVVSGLAPRKKQIMSRLTSSTAVTRAVAGGIAGTVWCIVPLAFPSAPAQAHTPPTDVCATLDPATLPRTADAAEAWFASCRRHLEVPPTADSADVWLR